MIYTVGLTVTGLSVLIFVALAVTTVGMFPSRVTAVQRPLGEVLHLESPTKYISMGTIQVFCMTYHQHRLPPVVPAHPQFQPIFRVLVQALPLT